MLSAADAAESCWPELLLVITVAYMTNMIPPNAFDAAKSDPTIIDMPATVYIVLRSMFIFICLTVK